MVFVIHARSQDESKPNDILAVTNSKELAIEKCKEQLLEEDITNFDIEEKELESGKLCITILAVCAYYDWFEIIEFDVE